MQKNNSNKKSEKLSSLDIFWEKLLYVKPYKGNNKVLLHPKMGNDESRNRQCKNRNRNRNNKGRQDLRFEKICAKQSKSCGVGKQKITHQYCLDIDQESIMV